VDPADEPRRARGPRRPSPTGGRAIEPQRAAGAATPDRRVRAELGERDRPASPRLARCPPSRPARAVAEARPRPAGAEQATRRSADGRPRGRSARMAGGARWSFGRRRACSKAARTVRARSGGPTPRPHRRAPPRTRPRVGAAAHGRRSPSRPALHRPGRRHGSCRQRRAPPWTGSEEGAPRGDGHAPSASRVRSMATPQASGPRADQRDRATVSATRAGIEGRGTARLGPQAEGSFRQPGRRSSSRPGGRTAGSSNNQAKSASSTSRRSSPG
jgi:hypothetical protein